MPAFFARLPELRAWGFNVLVCCAGLAIVRSEIDVVYQPVLLVDERRIVGAEALARWNRRGRPCRRTSSSKRPRRRG